MRERVLAIDGFNRTDHADNRVQLEQRDRGIRTLQVDAAVQNSLHDSRRQGVRIDFQADGQSGRRINRRRDHFVHAQGVGPLRFIAERIEAEDLLALRDHDSVATIQALVSSTLAAKGTLDKSLRSALSAMNLPSTGDLEILREKVDELERLLASVEGKLDQLLESRK